MTGRLTHRMRVVKQSNPENDATSPVSDEIASSLEASLLANSQYSRDCFVAPMNIGAPRKFRDTSFLFFFMKRYLLENEERVMTLHRSIWSFFGSMFSATILILCPLFFILPLFHTGTRGIAVFAVSLFLGLLLILRIFWKWLRNYVILTTSSLIDIDKRHIFHPAFTRYLFSNMRGVKCAKRTWKEILFNYGALYFKMGNMREVLALKHVPHPFEVKEMILSVVNTSGRVRILEQAGRDREQHEDIPL